MTLIDIIELIVFALVTWSVAGEGVFGAAVTCLCVIFGGLLAMNFFEPVALILRGINAGSPWWRHQCDVLALMGLFAVFVFLLRLATDRLAPRFIDTGVLVHELGRWGCGLLTGYVTMAFLLTAVHTAPFPRDFIGFRPERKNLFGKLAPDRQWLGFTQYVSEHTLKSGKVFDGTQAKLGNQENQTWPSFIIRYASRRQLYHDPTAATALAPAASRPAAPTGGPSSGTVDF